ncbi:ROK family protein [Ligilactobacillus murinus]|uniref:ROK family protein n=1 Tax=Ligilactobacillus murinus TaxID=1622 RepID=UPI0013BAAA6A|nr:ROK family protein [Ligilactobacillus murinus]NEF85393.1 ROK family protein [Ligilactobacillus murinus]NEF94510.1 ROK family protein [Ligilactobacillus murinus]NEF96709.1 ROK family protein [Ligilactobacillus murinus]NEG03506.1 ROK family protein [Ligilactobacillus murinus]NEG05757.1 ROK family protein [Ligilactobacillus murinus]
MISSKYTIREQNEAQILNQIIKEKEISRAKLSQVTLLNKASVSAITKKLLADHLILEKRIGELNTPGRKPIMLTFNNKAALVIGLDLGYNYIDGMLSFLDGSEIRRFQLTETTITQKNFFQLVDSVITELTLQLPQTVYGIIGMTVAIQGQVLHDKFVSTAYDYLADIDLIQELNAKFDFPVNVENEANLSALGEYTFSSHFENLISVSLHNSIGAGIVKNGKLEIGKKGYAGQLGHTILFPDGRKCGCGNHGCLKQYCTTQVIYSEINQAKNLAKVNSDIIAELYYQNDETVQKMLGDYAKYLAIGVNNTIMLYAPELVILNSALTKKIPEFVTMIQNNLKNQFAKEVNVINSPISWNPAIYGAIAFSIQRFLNIEQLKLDSLK